MEVFRMKVQYPVAAEANIKAVKDMLKPFGGRCAKIVEGQLEYLISEDKEQEAYTELKEKGIVS
jgi:hypothetical protein